MAKNTHPTLHWTQEDCEAWLAWIRDTFEVAIHPRINVTPQNPGGLVWEVGLECRTAHSSEEPGELLFNVWTIAPKGSGASLWAMIGRCTGLLLSELQLLYASRYEPT